MGDTPIPPSGEYPCTPIMQPFYEDLILLGGDVLDVNLAATAGGFLRLRVS